MAIPTNSLDLSGFVKEAFLQEYAYRPQFFTDVFRRDRLPTEGSIKRDVSRLKSCSAAGRKWIADRRMAIASVGPWKDVFVFKRDGRYPAIITRHRGGGKMWEVTTELKLRE